MTKSPPTDERLDELYREHPDGFVAGRNALAKDLRDAGERDEAERVKKLRRPSAAAWLINRAALTAPNQLAEFAEASQALEEAQTRALEGDDEGAAAWRAAADRERSAAAGVVDAARSAADEAGHKAGQRTLELVDATLRAAAANPELRERVLRGRVERAIRRDARNVRPRADAGPRSRHRQAPSCSDGRAGRRLKLTASSRSSRPSSPTPRLIRSGCRHRSTRRRRRSSRRSPSLPTPSARRRS